MLSKLDHVTIAVLDVEAATESYQRLLGSAPAWRGTHPEVGTRAALFRLPNTMIELLGPLSAEAEAPETEALRALLQTRGEGLQTLSFATDDAAACSRTLRERGVRATPPQDGEARSADGALRTYKLVELSPRSTRALPISVVERPFALPGDSLPGTSPVLDHVLIASADLDQAAALYQGQLGLRLALDREVAGRRMLFFRIGGVTVEIVHDPARGAEDLLAGLAYRVADLEATHARLLGEGFALSAPRAGAKPGTEVFTVRSGSHGVPTLILRDPSRDPRPA